MVDIQKSFAYQRAKLGKECSKSLGLICKTWKLKDAAIIYFQRARYWGRQIRELRALARKG